MNTTTDRFDFAVGLTVAALLFGLVGAVSDHWYPWLIVAWVLLVAGLVVILCDDTTDPITLQFVIASIGSLGMALLCFGYAFDHQGAMFLGYVVVVFACVVAAGEGWAMT